MNDEFDICEQMSEIIRLDQKRYDNGVGDAE